MSKIPIHNFTSGTKRRIDMPLDNVNNNNETAASSSINLSRPEAKRLNMSMESNDGENSGEPAKRMQPNKFENNLFEIEIKSYMMKNATLETELKSIKNEKNQLKQEFDSFKEAKQASFKELEEQKIQLEKALKTAKTNNEFLNSELDTLRKRLEEDENEASVGKDKEISKLKDNLKELEDEKSEMNSQRKKDLDDYKFEIDSKCNSIAQLESEIRSLNENLKKYSGLNGQLDEYRKEINMLQNQIRDLEAQNSKLEEREHHNQNLMDQENKIDQLERENRAFMSEIDYLKAIQEKSHLYQEELVSKTSQLKRFETKIINLELENGKLAEEIHHLESKLNAPKEATSASDMSNHYKKAIADMETELNAHKEKYNNLHEDVRRLKADLSYKNDEIDQLHKRVTRLTTEKNGYKEIIAYYDLEKNSNETDASAKLLKKRVDQLELILIEYQKQIGDSIELKLCNNTSYKLDDNENKKCIGIQVNLNLDIYANYESRIESLKKDLEDARKKIDEKDLTLTTSASEDLDLTQKWQIENAKIQKKFNLLVNDGVASASNEEEDTIHYKQYKALEEKLENQVIINDRQIKAYAMEISKIKKIMRNLLGFKINFEENDYFKLVDGKNPENFLEFRLNKDYTLDLMPTTLARKYSNIMEIFINQNRSMVGYIAAVSLELAGKTIEIVN